MIRSVARLFAACAPLLLVALALLWAVYPQADLPWSRAPAWSAATEALEPMAAHLQPADEGLELRPQNAGENFGVAVNLPALDADQVPFLHFEASASPGLRPVLIWSAAGQSRHAVVPWRSTGSTVDLSSVPGWEGRIDKLGLLWLPIDVLATADLPDRRARLRVLQLYEPSRRLALQALWTQWRSGRPWGGRSINTSGFEFGAPDRLSQPIWLALTGLALGWLLASLARKSLAVRGLVAAALAWVLVAGAHLAQQLWRAEVYGVAAEAAAAGAGLSAAPPLVASLARLRATLPSTERVIVHSASAFELAYGTFQLRDLDVAELSDAAQLPADVESRGAVLVLVGAGDWEYRPDQRQLRIGARQLRAEPLYAQPGAAAYAIGAAGDRP